MEPEKTNADWLAEAKLELEDLIHWSDELPEKFILNNPSYARHKFRGNWFQGVTSNVKLVADICKDGELMREAEEFAERKRAKGTNVRTTRDEIYKGDQLIRKALEKF